jgi:hypothetical protein
MTLATVASRPWNDIYAKLSEAISEIKNGAPVADAEEFIKELMNS